MYRLIYIQYFRSLLDEKDALDRDCSIRMGDVI